MSVGEGIKTFNLPDQTAGVELKEGQKNFRRFLHGS
jgi:hypothetical protein